MMGGAICGGVIRESDWKKAVEKGEFYGFMMCRILPNEYYEKYIKLLRQRKYKEANKILREHSYSII